ncbi:CCA tRNA nucleotidyltransferase [Halobacillus salinus]|uniref:CCA tRNA nucleotidyltransferase n=1 Tax=Halobacillus salinus TaxID=192814 RepID=UPI0009A5AAE4|nr:CCA tRNA nucleotidyltransferase [Halobacillus salinus]
MTFLEEAFEVLGKIKDSGGEAYIVGGAVRDLLMQREVGDIDIATSLLPGEVQELFDKVIPVGIEHGTVIVRHRGKSFEVTTFRTEDGYEDFRHPDEVTFVRDIKQDLARRDFTMNAVAMDLKGKLVDPYGGQKAVENNVIEAVGDPLKRFEEDPLRMLRAVRFVSQLGFELEPCTREALTTQASLLKHIAVERKASEMIKLFGGPSYRLALDMIAESDLIKELPILEELPSFQNHVPGIPLLTWPEVITYFLGVGIGSGVNAWTKAWKLSNQVRKDSEKLDQSLKIFKRHSSTTPWLVYQLPEELHDSFCRVVLSLEIGYSNIQEDLQRVHTSLPIRTKKDLSFESSDLIAMYPNRIRGPWIRDGLQSIEKAVVQGEVSNEYERIKEWVQQWNQQENN